MNLNQGQTGSPNGDGQRTLSDAGMKRHRVRICWLSPREARLWDSQIGSSSSCVLRSKVQECYDGFDGIVEFVDESFWWEWGVSGYSWKFWSVNARGTFRRWMCPVDCTTSVPKEKVHYSMNLENVLGVSLQHYDTKRNVSLINRTGSVLNVIFEVTDTKRAILSVHNDCDNDSMIVFTLDGKGNIKNDTKCFDQVKQIMEKRKRQWLSLCQRWRTKIRERLWNQFSLDMQRVLGTRIDSRTVGSWETEINLTVRPWWETKHVWACEGQGTSKALRVHERETSVPWSHTVSVSRMVCEICVKAKGPDGKHAQTSGESGAHSRDWVWLRVCYRHAWWSENFDDGCDRLNSWIDFCCCGNEKRWQRRLCDAEFPKLHRSVGFGEGRIKMWSGVRHFWYDKYFGQTESIHSSDCDCNVRRL